jgi:hypothetical protein
VARGKKSARSARSTKSKRSARSKRTPRAADPFTLMFESIHAKAEQRIKDALGDALGPLVDKINVGLGAAYEGLQKINTALGDDVAEDTGGKPTEQEHEGVSDAEEVEDEDEDEDRDTREEE